MYPAQQVWDLRQPLLKYIRLLRKQVVFFSSQLTRISITVVWWIEVLLVNPKFRSNLPEVFCKKEVFSCAFCEISKNTFFTEQLRWLFLKICQILWCSSKTKQKRKKVAGTLLLKLYRNLSWRQNIFKISVLIQAHIPNTVLPDEVIDFFESSSILWAHRYTCKDA